MAKIKRTMTVSLEEFGKKAGEYALDEFEYNGLTIRQWANKITSGEYQPVKHGRWIVTKTERGWNCAEYPVEWTCSECKVANDRKDGFCPHCGARMDGDSE